MQRVALLVPSITATFLTIVLLCNATIAADDRATCRSAYYDTVLDIDDHINACTRAIWQYRADYRVLVDLYYQRGVFQTARGKFDSSYFNRAIDDFNYLISAILPNAQGITAESRAGIIGNRGKAYHVKGDLELAIADYKRAMAFDLAPTSVSYWRSYLSDAEEELAEEQKLKREQQEREAQAERLRRQQENAARDEEDRRRSDEIFNAYWKACTEYDVSACDAALQSPLGTNRYQLIVSTRSTAQRFNSDLQTCKSGSVSACDLVLSFPNITSDTKAYAVAWREAASPLNKLAAFASGQADWIRNYLRSTPTSTLVASGVATAFGFMLAFLLLHQRRFLRGQVASSQPTQETSSAVFHEEIVTRAPQTSTSLTPRETSLIPKAVPDPMPLPPTLADPAEGMALKLKRSTKTSGMGNIIYMLDARLDASAEIRALISQHRLGGRVIYESSERQRHRERAKGHVAGSASDTSIFAPPSAHAEGLAKSVWKLGRAAVSATRAALALRITVDSLMAGVHVECKSMEELLEAEEAIKEAKDNLEGYISAITSFDGREEVI